MIEHILTELGTRLPRKLRRKAIGGFEAAILDDPPHLENGTEVVLKSLSSSHKIGLISNSGVTPGKILRKMLKSHKIYDYFQCTVFSDEVGARTLSDLQRGSRSSGSKSTRGNSRWRHARN